MKETWMMDGVEIQAFSKCSFLTALECNIRWQQIKKKRRDAEVVMICLMRMVSLILMEIALGDIEPLALKVLQDGDAYVLANSV